jgi:hypothetical protein
MTQKERANVRCKIVDLTAVIAAVQAQADEGRGDADVQSIDHWLAHRRDVLAQLTALR